MSTRTRAQHQSSPSTRRFAKPGAKPQGRRPAAAGRPRAIDVARRRKPPKSSTAKALEALTGRVGGKKASSSGAKGAKAGAGVAMLTAAAGLAFKNREKLTSMLKRDGGAPATDASAPPMGTTGAAVHPVTSANATDRSADAGGTAVTSRPGGTSGHVARPDDADLPARPRGDALLARPARRRARRCGRIGLGQPARDAAGRSPRGSRPTPTRGPTSRRATAAEPRAPGPVRRVGWPRRPARRFRRHGLPTSRAASVAGLPLMTTGSESSSRGGVDSTAGRRTARHVGRAGLRKPRRSPVCLVMRDFHRLRRDLHHPIRGRGNG